MRTVRIGAGQGFYGDSLLPVLDVAKYGDVKYIAFDTLAELTLAILEKGRKKDPSAGYTKDVVPMMRNLLPICHERGIKLITNAGGINPKGAAEAVAAVAKELGLSLKIACVTGDDIYGRLDDLEAAGVSFLDKESGQPLGAIREKLLFASVYLGARPIAKALEMGADVVITGRTTDTAQFLGPMIYEFGWGEQDWDRLAQGIILGHLMECSGQVAGGNLQVGWENVPDLHRIGYPVAEVSEDGSFILTKPANTGGLVDVRTVKEQFLYEIHDPTTYITPDVICDLSTTQIKPAGENRVSVSGTKGRPAPPTLKALLGYSDGWMGEGYISFAWPKAYSKAKRAAEIVRARLAMQGVQPEEILEEYIGINSLWGKIAPEPTDEDLINEVRLRMAIRTQNKKDCDVLAREFPPLLLSGPPTASAVAGTPQARELMGLWSTLIPRELIEPATRVEVIAVEGSGAARPTAAPAVTMPPIIDIEAATPDLTMPPIIDFEAVLPKRVRLIELCHARSGDKGDASDISLFANDERAWAIIREHVTLEKVAAYFAPVASGPVERWEVPNVMALKFLVHGALGGGAPRSLRSDNLGKTFASALLRMEIQLEA
jgi:hypothetical protein